MLDYTIFLIAISLAIDCFIVSITLVSTQKISKKNFVIISTHFGIFQGGMTFIGFLLGNSLLHIIEGFDHWIAFGLLSIIGLKMFFSSSKKEKGLVERVSYMTIILLSIATSIDALAMGVTFSIVDGSIIFKSIIIGFFSILLSAIGLIIGNRIKKHKFHYLGWIGGLVLIGLGIKVLIEHL
jgi:manganese efflux pump family protein